MSPARGRRADLPLRHPFAWRGAAFDFGEVSSHPEEREKWVLEEYKKIQADPASTDKRFFGHSYRYWSSFLASSPMLWLATVDARIYIAQGTEDQAVDPASADILYAELRRSRQAAGLRPSRGRRSQLRVQGHGTRRAWLARVAHAHRGLVPGCATKVVAQTSPCSRLDVATETSLQAGSLPVGRHYNDLTNDADFVATTEPSPEMLVATMAFAPVAAVSLAFVQPPGTDAAPTRFSEITVERLNLVEPDGKLRFVLSSRGRFPGDFYKGTEHPRPDRREVAGMLFLNDEGTECGGLIYNSNLNEDGMLRDRRSFAHLRPFRQDQVLQLLHSEGGGRAVAGLIVNDRTDAAKYSIEDLKPRHGRGTQPAGRSATGAYRETVGGRKVRLGARLSGMTGDQGSRLASSDAAGLRQAHAARDGRGQADSQGDG
jgi:hypothetical protein